MWTAEQRAVQRERFYSMYLNPKPGPGTTDLSNQMYDDASVLGEFAAPHSRIDLLPPPALVRLGVKNELSALKYKDAEQPLREGFKLSKRVDSLRRHFEVVHKGDDDEDTSLTCCGISMQFTTFIAFSRARTIS